MLFVSEHSYFYNPFLTARDMKRFREMVMRTGVRKQMRKRRRK